MPKVRAEEGVVLSLDIGTSSCRTALFDSGGHPLGQTMAQHSYSVRYGGNGAAELPAVPLEKAVKRCLTRTLRSHEKFPALRRPPILASVGSAFWHGLLGLDRQLRPITPILTWADSRSAADAAFLRSKLPEARIQARTGCLLRFSFWPAKLLFLRRTVPRLFKRVAYWVSPADWIFYRLCGALGCSASMASGTGLYNLQRKEWDPELLEICGVRLAALPEIQPCLTGKKNPFLPGRHIFTAVGDGAAGNLGSGADRPGTVAINLGTSAAVRKLQTAREADCTQIPSGLFRHVVDSSRVVTGGAVSNAGNLREWCVRELRVAGDFEARERILSREAAASDSLVVLPFWVRERAPGWPNQSAGLIHGLQQSSQAGQILRAAETSVFYRLAGILELLEKAAGRSRKVIVSGGSIRSEAAMRILADVLGREIRLSDEPEASLRGAAIYGLVQLGAELPRPLRLRKVAFRRSLHRKHRRRRERQENMEALMAREEGAGFPEPGLTGG